MVGFPEEQRSDTPVGELWKCIPSYVWKQPRYIMDLVYVYKIHDVSRLCPNITKCGGFRCFHSFWWWVSECIYFRLSVSSIVRSGVCKSLCCWAAVCFVLLGPSFSIVCGGVFQHFYFIVIVDDKTVVGEIVKSWVL